MKSQGAVREVQFCKKRILMVAIIPVPLLRCSRFFVYQMITRRTNRPQSFISPTTGIKHKAFI